MMKTVQCATYEGIEAKVVNVELTLTKGLPSFSIVGIASASINEAKERVKSALLSNNFSFPPKRITVNLSPSDLKKEGSHFDLSIALLIALENSELQLDTWFVFGELGLDGKIKENIYIYPLILSLAKQRIITKVIVPLSATQKLAKIPNIEFYGLETLQEAIDFFQKDQKPAPIATKSFEHPFYELNAIKYYYRKEYEEDFLDVRGQEIAKRAALIAAAGFHNILFEGSPGCGKSMIAKRMQYILPALSHEELLELAKLDALEMKEPRFLPCRNFRSPHHSATAASIFGGGSHRAMIGEVGLAHRSILFFDELPYFSKTVLEALREPMQDNRIRISRVNAKVEYPSDFLFIGAMNPCPCGNLLSNEIECRCNEAEIQRYRARLSDPFLDRIDLMVVMQEGSKDDRSSFSSKELHKKVLEANIFAKQRGQKCFNAKLDDAEVEKYCKLHAEAQDILEKAIGKYKLSFRGIKKVKKVARTIADLDGSEEIGKEHIFEALSYRRRR